jgi:hypothetical protein
VIIVQVHRAQHRQSAEFFINEIDPFHLQTSSRAPHTTSDTSAIPLEGECFGLGPRSRNRTWEGLGILGSLGLAEGPLRTAAPEVARREINQDRPQNEERAVACYEQ